MDSRQESRRYCGISYVIVGLAGELWRVAGAKDSRIESLFRVSPRAHAIQSFVCQHCTGIEN